MSIVADKLSASAQPLVPSQLFMTGGNDGAQSNMLGTLLSIITAEKLGVEVKPKKKTELPEAKPAEVILEGK